jgi:lipopolysaccharide exporter
VSERLSRRAGHAVRWRMAQLVGVNAIFLLRVLVLARILAPDDFGLLAVALVPIGVLLQASEFGMIPALIHSRSPERRHYDAAWTIGMARSLAVACLVFAAAPWVAGLANEPRAAEITRVLALHPLLLAAASIRMADLQRHLAFRPLAAIHLGEALANTAVAIALAPRVGVWALVAGMLAGSLTRLVISYALAPYAPRLTFQAEAARALIRFGRWVFVTSLVATLGGALLHLGISRWLGAAELGVYYLATRLTFLLSSTVSDVGTSVAFPIYARLQEERDEAVRIFRAVWSATAALIVPAFALLAVLAPTLVANVLGSHWEGSAPVIQVLALVTILSIFGDVTSPVWQGMGQPWRSALIETAQTSLLLLGVWWLAPRMGVIGAAVAWLPAIAVSQLLCAVFLSRVLPRPLAGLGGLHLAVLAAAGAGALLAAVVQAHLPGLAGTIAAALGGAALALALLHGADRRLALGLWQSLLRLLPPALGRPLDERPR